ncbi:MAG: 3-phosphoshikimate 1-carboxyvinyltransferase [Acidobacteriota bacterium]
MKIRPARRLHGRVRLPGDKSISHRAAIIAALATGTIRVSNFATSADCAATLSCLKSLGVSIEREDGADNCNLRIAGVGKAGFDAPNEPLDCGNSGSTMRMLAGVLAGQDFTSTVTGDSSLRSRPMKRIIEPLQQMGANIESKGGKPPITISGSSSLNSIRYALPVASAQVKSCVLLAGLYAKGHTEVSEPLGATRDHTERMLRWFGVPLEIKELKSNGTGRTIGIDGTATLAARDVSIPGDISSAAFLIAAAALLPQAHLEIEDVGLNPTRTQFLSTLRSLGCDLDVMSEAEASNEPVGTIRISGRVDLAPSEGAGILNGPLIAQLIDELPLLAVVGSQIAGGIEIRDAGELRLKESDRISATAKNLRAMGAEVAEFSDGLSVGGPTRLRGARLNSWGDHRIAMAFAVAGLIASGESEISGAECVSVSFPGFFTLLESLVER